MKYNNQDVVLEIPSLRKEWLIHVGLFYRKKNNIVNFFLITKIKDVNDRLNDLQKIKGSFTIFHTIIGDINKFTVSYKDVDVDILQDVCIPIFEKCCKHDMIELDFIHK